MSTNPYAVVFHHQNKAAILGYVRDVTDEWLATSPFVVLLQWYDGHWSALSQVEPESVLSFSFEGERPAAALFCAMQTDPYTVEHPLYLEAMRVLTCQPLDTLQRIVVAQVCATSRRGQQLYLNATSYRNLVSPAWVHGTPLTTPETLQSVGGAPALGNLVKSAEVVHLSSGYLGTHSLTYCRIPVVCLERWPAYSTWAGGGREQTLGQVNCPNCLLNYQAFEQFFPSPRYADPLYLTAEELVQPFPEAEFLLPCADCPACGQYKPYFLEEVSSLVDEENEEWPLWGHSGILRHCVECLDVREAEFQ